MNTKFNKHSIAFLFSNNFFFLQINYYKKLQKKSHNRINQSQRLYNTMIFHTVTVAVQQLHWIYTFTVDYIYLYIYSPIYHSNQHIFNVSFKEHILETYPTLRLHKTYSWKQISRNSVHKELEKSKTSLGRKGLVSKSSGSRRCEH